MVDPRRHPGLAAIVYAASHHYPGAALASYFDPLAGRVVPRKLPGDLLARFLVQEIVDSYDPKADALVQVDAAIAALQRAQDKILDALRGLHQLRNSAMRPGSPRRDR